MRRAIDPPVQSKSMLTYDLMNLMGGHAECTVACIASVTSFLCVFCYLLEDMTLGRWVYLVVPCCQRCDTHKYSADNVHPYGYHIRPWPMHPLLALLFFAMKRRLKISRKILVGWVETYLKCWSTINNWVSWKLKRWFSVSVTPWQYSPGRRRKKKVFQARSLVTFFGGYLPVRMCPRII